MANMAIDKASHDLIKGVRVSEGRYTVQQCECRLRVILGEWALDQSQGWINVDDFGKNYDVFNIESKAREVILGTKGVLEITSMNSTYSNRVFNVSFTAVTKYGTISLTVPWGVQ